MVQYIPTFGLVWSVSQSVSQSIIINQSKSRLFATRAFATLFIFRLEIFLLIFILVIFSSCVFGLPGHEQVVLRPADDETGQAEDHDTATDDGETQVVKHHGPVLHQVPDHHGEHLGSQRAADDEGCTHLEGRLVN